MTGDRPPSLLPVIGWSSLAGALALLFGGLFGFKLIALVRQPGPFPFPPGMAEGMDLKDILRPLEGTLQVLSWLQILLAPPLAVVSVEFLKRRAWARRGLEALTWAMALLTAAFPFFIVPFCNGLFRSVLWLGPQDPLPGAARLIGPGLGMVMTAALEFPFYLTLKALRSPGVRSACML